MQGPRLKINKIFFLTYPINSYIIFRRREERVGGTHPLSLQPVVSACGRDPP